MTAVSPEVQLERLLLDAKVVQPHLTARREDVHAERLQKIAHYYAIDTNILYFIGQPIAQVLSQGKLKPELDYLYGRDREPVPQIGSIFRNDEPRYHLTIGASLAQFIGFALSGTSPLYLPDALWPEAQHLLDRFEDLDEPDTIAIAHSLFQQLEKRTISKVADQLRAAGVNPDKLSKPLRDMVKHKIGRHQGIKQLASLIEGGGVEALGARPLLGDILGIGLQARKLSAVRAEHLDLEQPLIAKWDNALYEAGKKASQHRVLDARALAQIELRNRTAYERGSLERTLYITADAHVILAAETIDVDYRGCKFAEAFVRHPAAFLNDIGLGVGRPSTISSSNSLSEAASIVDFVDLLLNKSFERTEADAGVDQNWAQKAVDEIRESWNKLSLIQEDQLFMQLGIDEIEKTLQAKLANSAANDLIVALQDEVVEREAAAWRQCFDVSIQLALLGLRRHIERQPTRSAPLICFEAWPKGGEAIEHFKIWGARGISSRDHYEAALKQLHTDEDNSGYTYYLAAAAFFAARGDWKPAAGVAAFAREMAFRRKSDRGANGREAAYVEAVARRHLVSRRVDLERPRELLAECERIFNDERANPKLPLDIVPERFALERLDIEQINCLFLWSEIQNADSVTAAETAEALAAAMAALLHDYAELQGKLQKQVDHHFARRTPMLLGSEPYVLVQTEVRTIISAVLLNTIEGFKFSRDTSLIIDRLLDRLPQLRIPAESTIFGSVAHAETQDGSFLAEIGVAVAEVQIGEILGRRQHRRTIDDALRALKKNHLKNHITFPFFDEKRFDRMREILERSRRQ